MLIGELAKTVNTSIDTIRYYEREGLLTPVHVRDSGYREFDDLSIDLCFVNVGFPINFINDEYPIGLEIGVATLNFDRFAFRK